MGGLVGAITALATLPGLVMSTWNGSLRIIDGLTEPDIVTMAGQLNLRCLVIKPPDEAEGLSLEHHCDPGNFAVSGTVALTNADRIARTVTDLRAEVRLLGEQDFVVDLARPLSVRHEVVDGKETVVWFDWTPLELDPQSTHVEELAFDQHGIDGERWETVRRGLFAEGSDPIWDGVEFTLWSTVFDEVNELVLLRCKTRFMARSLELRRNDPQKQIRMPFNCVADAAQPSPN